MDGALLALVALACPLGMVLMMVFMGRGMGRRNPDARSDAARGAPPSDDVDALRAERERLDEQIGTLEAERAARR